MRKYIVIIILQFLTFCLFAKDGKVKFMSNLSSAKEIARAENKPIFIEFSAVWCQPCLFMEETTFQDPSVVYFIHSNYIPVKVDIDDFDGHEYKRQYKIDALPTTLILSPQGKFVARYVGALGATEMLALLKKHDLPNDIASSTPSKKPVSDYIPTRPTPPAAAPKTKDKNTSSGNGLYRLDISRAPSQGFSLQVGVFNQYTNLLKEIERIHDLLDKDVLVYVENEGANGQPNYKLLVGEFKTKEAATKTQKAIKSQGMETIIKDLSLFK